MSSKSPAALTRTLTLNPNQVRTVSPSKQQVTRSAGITELARAELSAAELTVLGPR